MMKSITSDLWYVGKVLANEPNKKDGGVGQKGVREKNNLCMLNVRGLFTFLLFHCCWMFLKGHLFSIMNTSSHM